MKNQVLTLLLASILGLSFSACADDQKASMAEKTVEKAKEVVAETTDSTANVSASEEKADGNTAAKTDEKASEDKAPESTETAGKAGDGEKKDSGKAKEDEEPDCD
ncbi:MAG: hypothetical protein V3U84_05480 [Thiotrichaceae bacterium]